MTARRGQPDPARRQVYERSTLMDRIKAILFDHDGTLVDSEPVHYQMWAEILGAYGVTLGIDEYARHYAGIPTTTNAGKLINDYPALPLSASTLIDAKNNATRDFLSRSAFPLMPGARQAIDYFHGRALKMAIVTGAGADGVQATVRANQLDEHISVAVSGDDVNTSKPAPDCYLLALQKLGVDSSECIAIEDTENGVTAATRAGIACLAVATPMTRHHNFGGAMNVFDNLTDATGWMTENFRLAPDDC